MFSKKIKDCLHSYFEWQQKQSVATTMSNVDDEYNIANKDIPEIVCYKIKIIRGVHPNILFNCGVTKYMHL